MSIDTLTTQPHEVAEDTPDGVVFLPEQQSSNLRASEVMAEFALLLCHQQCPIRKLQRDTGHKLCAAEVLRRDQALMAPAVVQGFAASSDRCREDLTAGKPMSVHQVV